MAQHSSDSSVRETDRVIPPTQFPQAEVFDLKPSPHRPFNWLKQWEWRRLPLQRALAVPFVVQIVVVVGLVSYVSFRNGQEAVNELANQLRNETSERLNQQILSYLETPYIINQTNADALSGGRLQTQGTANEQYFWKQIQLFDSVSWIYIGTQAKGDFLGIARRGENDALQYVLVNEATQNVNHYYGVNEQGNRTELIESSENKYDPRQRPWYIAAVETGKPTWSEIYPDFGSGKLAITHSLAAYGPSGELLGVCAVDLFLEDIDSFLSTLKVGKSGQTFIIERSGDLVSSSSAGQSVLLSGDEAMRVAAIDSSEPLIQQTAQQLTDRFGELTTITQKTDFTFSINGERHFVQVSPIQDGQNIDWLSVIVVPESDFMAQINANTRITIVFCLVAFAGAIALGIITSRWLAKPIEQLNQASRAIAQGDWNQTVEVKGVDELEELSHTFNHMTGQLRQAFEALENSNEALEESNRELERRVEERTVELREAKAALQNRAIELMKEVAPVQTGDLTVRPRVTADEIGTIADSYNATIASLRNIILQVQTAAHKVVSATESHEGPVQDLRDEAIRQATEIQQALQQIEQLEAVVQQVAQRTQQAEAAVRQAEQVVATGDNSMNQTVEEMQAIQTMVSETLHQMRQLGESSEQISKVVELINSFAAQTNILALNASIEASRAGEHGKGFTIISKEVRQLANQSAKAAQDVQQLIGNIQTETQQVIKVMESGSKRVVTGSQLVSKMRQNLNQITAMSQQINEVVTAIAQSTVVQSQLSAKVTEMMQDVAAIAKQTSVEATDVSASFQELRQVASALQDEVSQFKLS